MQICFSLWSPSGSSFKTVMSPLCEKDSLDRSPQDRLCFMSVVNYYLTQDNTCWSASQNGFRCNHQDRLPHNFPSSPSSLSNRSIGVLTYVMLTGESPFLGDDKQQTFLNISQVNIDYSQDTFEGISSLAIDFIKSLLVKSPGWALSNRSDVIGFTDCGQHWKWHHFEVFCTGLSVRFRLPRKYIRLCFKM